MIRQTIWGSWTNRRCSIWVRDSLSATQLVASPELRPSIKLSIWRIDWLSQGCKANRIKVRDRWWCLKRWQRQQRSTMNWEPFCKTWALLAAERWKLALGYKFKFKRNLLERSGKRYSRESQCKLYLIKPCNEWAQSLHKTMIQLLMITAST